MSESVKKILVRCQCGNIHEFSPQLSGRIARCPTLQARFEVPEIDGEATFIDIIPRKSEQQAATGIFKRIGRWLAENANRSMVLRRSCNCAYCRKNNPETNIVCSRCGCPLHNEDAALLFMEKRRQEAHELKMAAIARDQWAHSARPVAPTPATVQQSVIVRQESSGCLSIIGGAVVVIVIFFIILSLIASAK